MLTRGEVIGAKLNQNVPALTPVIPDILEGFSVSSEKEVIEAPSIASSIQRWSTKNKNSRRKRNRYRSSFRRVFNITNFSNASADCSSRSTFSGRESRNEG